MPQRMAVCSIIPSTYLGSIGSNSLHPSSYGDPHRTATSVKVGTTGVDDLSNSSAPSRSRAALPSRYCDLREERLKIPAWKILEQLEISRTPAVPSIPAWRAIQFPSTTGIPPPSTPP